MTSIFISKSHENINQKLCPKIGIGEGEGGFTVEEVKIFISYSRKGFLYKRLV